MHYGGKSCTSVTTTIPVRGFGMRLGEELWQLQFQQGLVQKERKGEFIVYFTNRVLQFTTIFTEIKMPSLSQFLKWK